MTGTRRARLLPRVSAMPGVSAMPRVWLLLGAWALLAAWAMPPAAATPAAPAAPAAAAAAAGREVSSSAAIVSPELEPIQPLPVAPRQDPRRVELGRKIFHDPRFSSDGKVSCASCHDLSRGGVDGRQNSVGVHGRMTALNAPTVYNAALNFRQFWDGRVNSLEAQVDHVFESPVEMGGKWADIVATMKNDRDYAKAFGLAYTDGVTRDNIKNAVATFERTLYTPNARFDRYLRGERDALTQLEKTGYRKFKQFGCVACHQGVNAGGNMFQKFGVMVDPAQRPVGGDEALQGRFAVTRQESDRFVFKVPGLRNVELTAPYFHDGSAPTLDAAVEAMFRYQLGRHSTPEDREAIVAFLRTLTGEPARPAVPSAP